MFDIADQVQMKVNSAKKYKGDKLRQYKKDNQILFQFENTISRSLRNYRKITKQKNEMLESTVLSGEEKTKRQEAFDKKLFNIAESTVTKFSKRINEIERDK
jgi:recombinational DNA repair ATPase RecF